MFYTLATPGSQNGIFLELSAYETAVSDTHNPFHRDCNTLQDATRFLNCGGFPNAQICIHRASGTMSLDEYCRQSDVQVPREYGRMCYTLIDLGKKFHAEMCLVLGALCYYEYVFDPRTKEITKSEATFDIELLTMWAELIDQLKGETVIKQSSSDPLVFSMVDLRMHGEDNFMCELLREAKVLYT